MGEIKPYTINEISLSDKVNINITNNNSNTGLLCVASYKDNKLIDIELKQINIAQGQTDVISYGIDVPYSGTVKAFVWNNMISKQPFSKVMTINDIGIYDSNRVSQYSPIAIVDVFSMILNSLGNVVKAVYSIRR